MIDKEVYITPKHGTVITHKGLFNYRKLFTDAKSYSMKRNYDFTESNLTEKYKDKGNEFNVEWSFEKKVEDTMKYYIETIILITYAKKNKEMMNGNLKINVKAFMDLDYSEKWQKSALNKFLFFFYNNLVRKHKIYFYHIPKLQREFDEYIHTIKSALDFHR